MFYKIAILNSDISYSFVIQILSNISKFFIIIIPTISINHYIIYLILDSKDYIKELQNLKNNLIYNYPYNNTIYKIYRLYLSNYTDLSSKYIFIDYTFYNLNNVKIYNYLKSKKYLSILPINKKIKLILYNYFHYLKQQIFWIYHNNLNFLLFIKNYVINYKNNIFLINSNQLNQDFKQISLLFKYSSSNYIYILIDCISNCNKSIILNIIQFIQNNFKSIKLKYNILLLSTNNIVKLNDYNNLITYTTFSNLLYN